MTLYNNKIIYTIHLYMELQSSIPSTIFAVHVFFQFPHMAININILLKSSEKQTTHFPITGIITVPTSSVTPYL
uniref:Uncharacterized protein n=1 Tax=Anguilla anguilla TaxID=7936 RepID=A0A0E9WZ10_ANGAN